MIRRLRSFRLSPSRFFIGVPSFVWLYLRSRSVLLLIISVPLLCVCGVAVAAYFNLSDTASRKTLLSEYKTRSTDALQRQAFDEADLYFKRIQQLSGDRLDATFRFASDLYEYSPSDSDARRRAVSLMQSIAPREVYRPGSIDAHAFLARYWKTDAELSHVSTVLSLHHQLCADPTNGAKARALAEYVMNLDYLDQAIGFLLPFDRDPECLILLARCQLKRQASEKATLALDQAISLLFDQLASEQLNRKIRIRLSQALAARGRMMKSLFVLADGLRSFPDPLLSDHLIQRYVAWLNLLSPTDRSNQLSQIALCLAGNSADGSVLDTALFHGKQSSLLSLSTGDKVSLPAVIVDFHHSLLTEERDWLVPLLLASDELADGHCNSAVSLLRTARLYAPHHPVILNNLAWSLYRRSTLESTGLEPESLQETPPLGQQQMADLTEAFELAGLAIKANPTLPAFRQTRGVIASALKIWVVAVEDLSFCSEADYQFSTTLPLLKEALTQLAETSDSDQSS